MIDANIFVHALRQDTVLRPACQQIIDALASGDVVGEASSVLINEIVHVRHRRSGDRAAAVTEGRAAAALLVLHPVDAVDVDLALRVFLEHPSLQMSDAIHVAVARRHGLAAIVSSDRGFDAIPGVQRIDPADSAAVAELLSR